MPLSPLEKDARGRDGLRQVQSFARGSFKEETYGPLRCFFSWDMSASRPLRYLCSTGSSDEGIPSDRLHSKSSVTVSAMIMLDRKCRTKYVCEGGIEDAPMISSMVGVSGTHGCHLGGGPLGRWVDSHASSSSPHFHHYLHLFTLRQLTAWSLGAGARCSKDTRL